MCELIGPAYLRVVVREEPYTVAPKHKQPYPGVGDIRHYRDSCPVYYSEMSNNW